MQIFQHQSCSICPFAIKQEFKTWQRCNFSTMFSLQGLFPSDCLSWFYKAHLFISLFTSLFSQPWQLQDGWTSTPRIWSPPILKLTKLRYTDLLYFMWMIRTKSLKQLSWSGTLQMYYYKVRNLGQHDLWSYCLRQFNHGNLRCLGFNWAKNC